MSKIRKILGSLKKAAYPSCFDSYPNAQAQAENDCSTCKLVNSCSRGLNSRMPWVTLK
jgi:hypothetical protein